MTKDKNVTSHPNQTVRVCTPARLHLGFLDLNGESGRKFGSIGLAIDSHHTIIEAKLSSSHTQIQTQCQKLQQRIERLIQHFFTHLATSIPREQQNVEIKVIEAIPEHAGLGSGTQLALTVGTALCRLYNYSATTLEIAAAMGRGKRSGIGIASFDHGGFIVDGGLKPQSTVPPLLMHTDFPSSWHIVLVMEHGQQGVHGKQESSAFSDLPTFPITDSQAICHLTLMTLLPALKEQDIDTFGQAVTAIQAHIGDHFSPAQGGRYTSQKVAALLNYAKELGHYGIAQSSWGPTGCIFVENKSSAEALKSDLAHYINKQFTDPDNYSLIIATANDSGARIDID